MPAPIRLTGIAPDFRTPGGYAEIEFAQGPANAALGERESIIVGPRLGTGTAVTGVLYEAPDDGTGALLTGTGSPVHRAVRKYVQYGSSSKLYVTSYTGSGVAATFGVALGGAPTKRGQLDTQVCDTICSYGFLSTDTLSDIANGVVSSVNQKTYLPVLASAFSCATGTGYTLTAKAPGTIGNLAIRVRTEVTSGAGVTVSAGGDLSGGTGDDATRLTTALATLDNIRKYFLGVPVSDATRIALVKTHVNNKSQPLPGLRSVATCATRDTLANATTVANGLNFERQQLVWNEDSDHDPAELVGEIMGLRSTQENRDSSANMAGTALNLNKQYDVTDWPTPDEQSTAINEGISAIASNDSGAYLVMSCTTRSKNNTGTVNDFRATETHRVSVPDEYMDRALITWALNYQGKKYKDDERTADGLINPNQVYTSGTVRPSQIATMLVVLLRQFDDEEKIQNVESSIETLRSQKSTVNAGRNEAQVNIHTIDHHHQGLFLGKEVSSG
jgi:phage tail sheath gpL-like